MRLASTLAGGRFFAHLNAFQTIIVLAFAFAVAARSSEQSVEWYRYLAQSLAGYYDFGQRQGLTESIIFVASLTLLSLVFLLSLIFLRSVHLPSDAQPDTQSPRPFPLAWIACIPLLTVGMGFMRATIDVSSVDLNTTLFTGAKMSFARDGQSAHLPINWRTPMSTCSSP